MTRAALPSPGSWGKPIEVTRWAHSILQAALNLIEQFGANLTFEQRCDLVSRLSDVEQGLDQVGREAIARRDAFRGARMRYAAAEVTLALQWTNSISRSSRSNELYVRSAMRNLGDAILQLQPLL